MFPLQDDRLDEIFERIGGRRVSRKNEGVNALCCLMTGPLVSGELAMAMRRDNIKDARDCRAEALMTVCPMCDRVMRDLTAKAGRAA